MIYLKVGSVFLSAGTVVTFITTLVHGITPIPSLLASTGKCKPHTWANPTTPGQPAVTFSRPCPTHTMIHGIRGGDTQPGEINCRYESDTEEEVGPETCQEIADHYQISLEKFLFLNPSMDRDCRNILPCATYCTDGCE